MKRFIIISLIVALVAVGITSCATNRNKEMKKVESKVEEVEVVSVDPPSPVENNAEPVEDAKYEDASNWLSALGSINGLNVAKYRLRGEGPDGASFGWIDVKGTKVALSDIRRGEWTLYAEAIGEDGTVVATGSLKTFLSDSTPLGTLFLSEEVGSGNVECNFTWNVKQVVYPSIEVYMKSVDGNFVARDKSEIKIKEDGTATWTAKGIKAGTYVVRAILKDENEVISGVAAALRVIDGKKSIGNCQFVIGKLSTVYGIDLQNSPVDTVEGVISLSDGIISFDSDVENLVYTWFLDGDLLENEKSRTVDLRSLNLEKGYYRFDCIACNAAGFTSINTVSTFVYVDGDTIFAVTAEQADSNIGDIPEGYTETTTLPAPIVTDDETVETLMAKVKELMKRIPAENVNSVIEEVKEEAEIHNFSELETWQNLYDRLKEEEDILTRMASILTPIAEYAVEEPSETPETTSENTESESTEETVVFVPIINESTETTDSMEDMITVTEIEEPELIVFPVAG